MTAWTRGRWTEITRKKKQVPRSARDDRFSLEQLDCSQALVARQKTGNYSGGKGEGFVAGDDPDGDDAGLVTLLGLGGIVGAGHGRILADRDCNLDGVRTVRGVFADDFVA